MAIKPELKKKTYMVLQRLRLRKDIYRTFETEKGYL
jgi:hypothetical protein